MYGLCVVVRWLVGYYKRIFVLELRLRMTFKPTENSVWIFGNYLLTGDLTPPSFKSKIRI